MSEAPVRGRRQTRPTLTWVPVRDARGRTRMEMRWLLPADRSERTAHAA